MDLRSLAITDARRQSTSRCFFYASIALVASSCFGYRASGKEEAAREAKIAVLSNHGYEESLARWVPTATYLTKEVAGWSFRILPLEPNDFEVAIDRETVDFAISCPSSYVKIEVLYQAAGIATMRTPYSFGDYHVFAGVLFCNSHRTDIADFADLRGKRLCGLHGVNCTTWHVVCIELLRHDLDPARHFQRAEFATSPEAVVAAVRSGRADAGVIRSDMFDRMETDVAILPGEFHVFHDDRQEHQSVSFAHSTFLYPERVFAKLRNTPDGLAEKIAVGLLKMAPESSVAEAARCSGWTIPHNYRPLREGLKALRVSPYESFGRVTVAGVLAEYGAWILCVVVLVTVVIGAMVLVLIQGRRLSLARRVILERQIVETSDRAQETLGETLHDTFGQHLTAIRLLAETLRETDAELDVGHTKSIRSICSIAREAVEKSKDIASQLYPAVLSRRGFSSALKEYLAAMSSTFDVRYTLRLAEDRVAFSPEVSLNLYRIVQEAVHNAIKHGNARHILVEIDESESFCRLVVENDGRGFCPGKKEGGGLGLHIMRYRANAIGGTLEVAPSHGGRTRVVCTFDRQRLGSGAEGRKEERLSPGKE